MNLTFLGGGHEIGASSTLVEIGAARVLVDCGIRMKGSDVLPNLAAITADEFRHLDAVILTHAHMDHSGALPLLHTQFPGVPVFMTAPTLGLIAVLLRDSLNIMRLRAEQEQETPLYSQAAVDSLFDNIIPVTLGSPVELGRSGVTATFYPAGHILGASLVCLEGVEQGTTRRVVFSGDIAEFDQLTIPGALPPRHLRPDVLVIESTYGDRLHAARPAEENALVELVEQTIMNKGQLLIPAFAVGRAQEILLILLNRLRAKKLSSFPIYVDGMVRSVCGVYSSFPAYQSERARRLTEHFGNPFFGATDEIQQVMKPDERDKILAGPPCAIIASSGMLSGGASAYYAKRMIHRPKDAIAFTGYQDEESPGRQLLDLAEGRTNQIRLLGETEQVGCIVRKYSLSAHADGPEIARLVEAVNPRQVVLVHGEGNARAQLADLINRTSMSQRRIYLPRSGDTLQFNAGRKRKDIPGRPVSAAGPGAGRELDEAALHELADYLREARPQSSAMSALEMLNLWYGTGQWTEDDYTRLFELLPKHERFRRHTKRQSLWVARGPATAKEATTDTPAAKPQAYLADAEDVLQTIKNAFQERPEAGLYHTGYHKGLRQMRLAFYFPALARERYGALWQQLTEGTGWTIHIRQEVHQERLAEVALTVLPEGTATLKRPSILLARQAVSLKLATALTEAAASAAQTSFAEQTGWLLLLESPVLALARAAEAPAALEAGPDYYPPPAGIAVLEINQTYRTIAELFEEAPEHERPTRSSLKQTARGEVIELAFVTAQIGQRHGALLSYLAERTGRALSVKPEPNLEALLRLAREVVPPSWGAQKFGVHKEQAALGLKVTQLETAQAELAEVSARLEALTGYRLLLK